MNTTRVRANVTRHGKITGPPASSRLLLFVYRCQDRVPTFTKHGWIHMFDSTVLSSDVYCCSSASTLLTKKRRETESTSAVYRMY